MTVAEYLSSVKERLLTDAQVSRFSIVRERETTTAPSANAIGQADLTLTSWPVRPWRAPW